jgi:hypothetical protein
VPPPPSAAAPPPALSSRDQLPLAGAAYSAPNTIVPFIHGYQPLNRSLVRRKMFGALVPSKCDDPFDQGVRRVLCSSRRTFG